MNAQLSGIGQKIRGYFDSAFNADEDAEYIHEQMNQPEANDKNVLDRLTQRSDFQRQHIMQSYRDRFHHSLMDSVDEHATGNVRIVLKALLMRQYECDVMLLRKAMDGMGTSQSLLTEITCTREGDDLMKMQEVYRAETGEDLIERVKRECHRDYEDYLVACLQGNRPGGDAVDPDAAEADARLLYEKGEKRWGTHEETFIEIMATRSFAQLAEIARAYDRVTPTGRSLLAACKSELTGSFETAIVTTLEQAINPDEYWGQKIMYGMMKGLILGTDDESLTRIIRMIVTRSDKEMVEKVWVFARDGLRNLH